MGGLLGGGPKGMLAPPLKLLGGLAPPLPTPMEVSLQNSYYSFNIVHVRDWPVLKKLNYLPAFFKKKI